MISTLATQAKLRAKQGEYTKVSPLSWDKLPCPREKVMSTTAIAACPSKDRELEGHRRFWEKPRAPAGSGNPPGPSKAMQHLGQGLSLLLCYHPLTCTAEWRFLHHWLRLLQGGLSKVQLCGAQVHFCWQEETGTAHGLSLLSLSHSLCAGLCAQGGQHGILPPCRRSFGHGLVGASHSTAWRVDCPCPPARQAGHTPAGTGQRRHLRQHTPALLTPPYSRGAVFTYWFHPDILHRILIPDFCRYPC